MSVPLRSIRLQKRSQKSLDTLSGSSGEIFFDEENATLRLYTANQSTSSILASRTWVENNTFSGDFNDLTNTPTIVTDYSQLTGTPNLSAVAVTGSYNDLVDAPDLGSLNVDISTINSIGDVDTATSAPSTGEVLQWNGANWVPALVQGFQDTNTTYTLTNRTGASGVDVVLTDSSAGENVVRLVASTGISIVQNGISNDIEISSTVTTPALDDVSDVVITSVSTGEVLKYDGANWVNSADAGGIALTNLSVTTNAPGTAGLSYNNTTGVFTYTPPDLSGVGGGIQLTDISVTTSPASSGGSLSYDNSTGVFTFRPASLIGYTQLSDFSVTTNTPAGNGSLSYNNTSGVFTFTPAGTSEVVDDTTPQLGGDLDLNNNSITGIGSINHTGNITSSGTITANDFVASAAGAPTLTSATTITLDAPDGTIVQNGPFRLPSFTTTEKNALTAVNGDMVYDSTLNKAQVYENGAWVSLV